MPREEENKRVQVKIYLLKERCSDPGDAIRDTDEQNNPSDLIRRPLVSPLRGLLITKRSYSKKPAWASFLEEGVEDTLEELSSASAAALLVLKANDRCFALTNGYAKSILDPSMIERRFGLKVALNAIDPNQLRSVDSRTVEEMTFHTRRQASRTSEVSSFGLDTSRDLLRGVTGTPRDSSLGSRMSGDEAVTLSVPTSVSDLPELCSKLLELYASEAYKERFEWIDHLQLVSDPEMLTRLDTELSNALSERRTEKMHLAPPEALEWQNVSGFYYWNPEKDSPKHEDLDIDDALNELAEHSRGDLTGDYLHRQYLWIEHREYLPVAKCSIYSALVFETELDGRLFVLSDSDWHEVDLEWANSIRSHVSSIKTADLPLPNAHSGEQEPIYNPRAAESLGAISMDRCVVRYGAGKDQFELCDILTDSRQLVEIKRKTQSSTLSHLFMQGQNSATLLAHDADFRSSVRQKAAETGLNIDHLVPLRDFSPRDYEIIYGIITKATPTWPSSLPFFSQLSLSSATRNLLGMGFNVSLALIQLD